MLVALRSDYIARKGKYIPSIFLDQLTLLDLSLKSLNSSYILLYAAFFPYVLPNHGELLCFFMKQDLRRAGVSLQNYKQLDSMCLTRYQKGLSRIPFLRKLFRSYRKRAGCVVIEKNERPMKVLLIGSTTEGKDIWKLPAGGIEQGETNIEAAARETFEESGVVGTATKLLYSYKDDERGTHTQFYLMTDFKMVKEDEYEEGLKGRRRQWFTLSKALKLIPSYQFKALERAIEIVQKEN